MQNEADRSVSLKPLGLDDIQRIAEWFWDFEDVALFDRTLPVPTNADAMRESWRASLEYAASPRAFWFIAEDADKTPLGVAGLESVNYIQGDAVVPAFVSKEARGRGLATAMLASLFDLAFDQLRLHRLTTFFREDNAASRHTLEKVGFVEEGRFREGWFADGARRDVVIVGMLQSEWAERRTKVLKALATSGKVSLTPVHR